MDQYKRYFELIQLVKLASIEIQKIEVELGPEALESAAKTLQTPKDLMDQLTRKQEADEYPQRPDN